MWRFILKIVLSFVIYNVTVSIINGVANGVALILTKAGSPDLWRILHEHLFWKWIAIGFTAGLIPLQFLFSVSGFFRSSFPEFLGGLGLEKMKRWIVVLASPVALSALMQWISDWFTMRSKSATVLTGGPSADISKMFEGFLSVSCGNVADIRLELWGDNLPYQCAVHVMKLMIFFSAAAYSLAPWVRLQFLKSLLRDHSAQLDSSLEASEMHVSTNRNEENQ